MEFGLVVGHPTGGEFYLAVIRWNGDAHHAVGYHAAMGTWIDDRNPTPEVRARITELEAEWKTVDQRIAHETDADKINSLLGRIDELEFEIDETVRSKQ